MGTSQSKQNIAWKNPNKRDGRGTYEWKRFDVILNQSNCPQLEKINIQEASVVEMANVTFN